MKLYDFIISRQVLMGHSSKSVEVRLPVCCVYVGIFDGIPGMDHDPVPAVNAYMGYRITGFIGSREKDDVSRFCVSCTYWSAFVVDPLGCGPRHIGKTAVC